LAHRRAQAAGVHRRRLEMTVERDQLAFSEFCRIARERAALAAEEVIQDEAFRRWFCEQHPGVSEKCKLAEQLRQGWRVGWLAGIKYQKKGAA